MTSRCFRKFLYAKDSHSAPNTVLMPSGEKYHWRYDLSGRVISLKTPSGDIQHYSEHSAINRLIRSRQPSFTNSSFLTSFVDKNLMIEYSTPGGTHSLTFQRDIYGRITQISADSDNIVLHYSQDNGQTQVDSIITLRFFGFIKDTFPEGILKDILKQFSTW